MTAVDPSLCPMCGKANQCPIAAGQSEGCGDCWCAGITIDQQTLERIPAAARGLACLCAECAGRPTTGEDG